MKKLTLIYFAGCPNIENAKAAIREAGYEFEEFDQNSLPEGHKYKPYSSPTILDGKKLLYGAKVSGGGCSVAKLSANDIRNAISDKSKNGIQKMTIFGGLFSGTLAALCCVGPVIFAFLGVSGAGFAATLSDYKWWFVGFCILFMSFAFLQNYRLEKRGCSEGSICNDPKKKKVRRLSLFASFFVAGILIASPLILEFKSNVVQAKASQNKVTKTYFVEGMTCGGCELGVREALKRTGVDEVNILTVDHTQPDPDNKIGMVVIQFDKVSYNGKETDCKIAKEIKKSPGYTTFWKMGERNPCDKPKQTKSKMVYDKNMSKICQRTCSAKKEYTESELVENLNAKPGDLTRCPVSGIVFEVKENNPIAYHKGTAYLVCCHGCKSQFERNPELFAKN